MIEILLGPYILATILSPLNTTTSVAPNNTSITDQLGSNTAAPSVHNWTAFSSNVSINHTQPSLTEYPRKVDSRSTSEHKFKRNIVKYPYVVSINKADANGSSLQICSGSIVTASVVLTACQCIGNVSSDGVELYSADSLHIIAGARKTTENLVGIQEISARSLEPHSKCKRDKQLVLFDLGLVFLKRKVLLRTGAEKVKVASSHMRGVMDEFNFIAKLKVVCYSPGWTYMRSISDEHLFVGGDIVDNPVWIISDDDCRQSYCIDGTDNLCKARFETQGHVCATTYRNASPCHEDVGGPLICDKRLYGVISNTVSCSSHLPQLYVSPHVVFQFIERFLPIIEIAELRSISESSRRLCAILLCSTTMISLLV